MIYTELEAIDTAILDVNGGDIGAAISLAENNRRVHARTHEAYMRYLLTGFTAAKAEKTIDDPQPETR